MDLGNKNQDSHLTEEETEASEEWMKAGVLGSLYGEFLLWAQPWSLQEHWLMSSLLIASPPGSRPSLLPVGQTLGHLVQLFSKAGLAWVPYLSHQGPEGVDV